MKETLGKILRIFTTVLMVLSICMMIFTVISVLTFNRSDRQLFGYRAFIVLSDSMSATDFKAGDLVLTRDVDPATLQPGDIIAFTSTNDENYGQTVTHKIRSLTTTADGEPGFITYGTTTGTDDTAVVTYMDVLGKYAGHLTGVGKFFNFLKTTPGYILCIFVPFALLILSQSVETVRLFRRYKGEQMAELQAEKDKIAEERRQSAEMLAELQALRAQLGQNAPEDGAAPVPDSAPAAQPEAPQTDTTESAPEPAETR